MNDSPAGHTSLISGRTAPAVPEGPATAPGERLRLFRDEVLAQRQNQWAGAVVLAPRRLHWAFTAMAVLACAGLCALLYWGTFTRTARLGGWLVPQEGVARVFAPRAGVVTALHVREGAAVRKGDPLFNLSDEVRSASLGATQENVMRRLQERRDSLIDEQEQQLQLLGQQQRALAQRLAALDSEHGQIESEITLLKARMRIALRSEEMHQEQFTQGFISEQKLQLVRAERLEQEARIAALERGRLANRRDHLAVQAELRDLPLRSGRERAQLDRGIAQLEQERAEAEARREIVVQAPHDGTVTSIQIAAGASADPGAPLLSIVPSDRRMDAHLYGPSRAIGFVRPGQRVLLRYQAYPFQKFGHHEGEVLSVSQSAVSPADLPRELVGLPSLTSVPGANAAEPIYRITVRLPSQALNVDRAALPLHAGMLLEADVALDRRRLIEWVLEPIYSVTGRWQP